MIDQSQTSLATKSFSQGRVVVTVEKRNDKVEKVTRSNGILIKDIVKEKNEQGVYETKIIEAPKESISDQIEKKKVEINENAEVAKKLCSQQQILKEQVASLGQVVNEKVKQYREEEKKRIEIQKKTVSSKEQMDASLIMPKMTEQQISIRLKELETELESLGKYSRVLAKDLQFAKQENQAAELNQQIVTLTTKIEETQNELKSVTKRILGLQKAQKDNERRLEDLENGKDEAAELNKLNQEYLQLKERLKKTENASLKSFENYDQVEKLINEYVVLLKDLFKDNSTKLVPFKDQFEKIKFDYQQKNVDSYSEELKQHREQKKQSKQDDAKTKIKPQKIVTDLQSVSELRNLKKEDFEKVTMNENNYYMLMKLSKDIPEQIKLRTKKFEFEKGNLDSQLNDLKMEKANLLVQNQEQEREKENALLLLKDKQFECEIKQDNLQQIKEKQELEKIKSTDKVKPNSNKLTPLIRQRHTSLYTPTKPEQLLAEKKKHLESIQDKLLKDSQNKSQPFNFSTKKSKNQSTIESKQSILDKLLDTKNRVSIRQWFGSEPNESTTICDDVNVVGSFSIEHRLHKLTVQHNPSEGVIYSLQAEYLKYDKKSIVLGDWQINKNLKNSEKIKTETLNLGVDDRIREITIQKDDGFICFLKFKTKQGILVSYGKLQQNDNNEEKQNQNDKVDEDEQPQEKEQKLTTFKVETLNVLITVFLGYQQKSDNEMALSLFGFELARKLNYEEKLQYEELKLKKIQEKQKKENLKLLEQSLASIG